MVEVQCTQAALEVFYPSFPQCFIHRELLPFELLYIPKRHGQTPMDKECGKGPGKATQLCGGRG